MRYGIEYLGKNPRGDECYYPSLFINRKKIEICLCDIDLCKNEEEVYKTIMELKEYLEIDNRYKMIGWCIGKDIDYTRELIKRIKED